MSNAKVLYVAKVFNI